MSSWVDVSASRFKTRIKFSPNVLWRVPWVEMALMTRLVIPALGEAGLVVVECAASKYCSFKTRRTRMTE